MPDSRAELYQEICAAFLGKRRQAHRITQTLLASHRQVVLQALAYEMMQQEIQEIRQRAAQGKIKGSLQRVNPALEPARFLQEVEQDSGLLLQRKRGIYAFAHLTFQEYLAAVHVQKQHLEADLIAHVPEKWWREVILLYCASNDASAFIKACLRHAETSMEALELAIDCEKEALQVALEVRSRLQALLQEGAESPDVQRRRMITSVLLARRLHRMVYLREETYRDTSLITCREYQLFLDEQPLQRKPDHWRVPHFPPGQGNTPVRGVRAEQARAFASWLTRREQGPWRYRLPRAGELNEQERAEILSDAGCWLQEDQGFCWALQPPCLPAELLEELLTHACPQESQQLSEQVNVVRRIIENAQHARDELAICDDLTTRPRRDPTPWFKALEGAIEQGRELARKLEQALSSSPSQDLPRACLLTLAVALALSSQHESREATSRVQRSLMRDLVSQDSQEHPLAFPFDSHHLVQVLTERLNQEEYRRLVLKMLDLYRNLAILQGRVQGRLPAREGILLVKEKR